MNYFEEIRRIVLTRNGGLLPLPLSAVHFGRLKPEKAMTREVYIIENQHGQFLVSDRRHWIDVKWTPDPQRAHRYDSKSLAESRVRELARETKFRCVVNAQQVECRTADELAMDADYAADAKRAESLKVLAVRAALLVRHILDNGDKMSNSELDEVGHHIEEAFSFPRQLAH